MPPDLDEFDEPGAAPKKTAKAPESTTEPAEPPQKPVPEKPPPAAPISEGRASSPITNGDDLTQENKGADTAGLQQAGVGGRWHSANPAQGDEGAEDSQHSANSAQDGSDGEDADADPEPESGGAGSVRQSSADDDPEPDADGQNFAEEATYTDDEYDDRISAFARVRALTLLAVGPLATGYVAIATLLAIIAGMADNAQFTTAGVLVAALPGWLAAYQVPIDIFGLELGVLPLLPTIALAVITAKAAARAAERLDLRRPGQAGLVVGTVTLSHALAGVMVAGFSADSVVSADPLAALYYPGLVAALAGTVGIARRCRLLEALARRADVVAVEGLRVGLVALVLLLTAGGAVVTFGLLTSITIARDLFPMGLGNAAGMLLLSIGYLPNAMIAATAFIAGPGFSLSTVSVAPLEFNGGRLPGVPLLAALPEHQAAWWPALFLLPLAIGIVVGRRLRHVDEDPVARLRGVAVATGVVAACFVVLAGTAGGRLGRGLFDPVSMSSVALSVALVLWMAVPGAIVAWFGGPRASREPLPGLIEPEEEDEVEDTEEHDLPSPRDAVEESGEVARE
jgi:Family of unknown function (DUF6350)